MSIRYTVQGDVEDVSLSLLKGYGSHPVLLFSVPLFSSSPSWGLPSLI